MFEEWTFKIREKYLPHLPEHSQDTCQGPAACRACRTALIPLPLQEMPCLVLEHGSAAGAPGLSFHGREDTADSRFLYPQQSRWRPAGRFSKTSSGEQQEALVQVSSPRSPVRRACRLLRAARRRIRRRRTAGAFKMCNFFSSICRACSIFLTQFLHSHYSLEGFRWMYCMSFYLCQYLLIPTVVCCLHFTSTLHSSCEYLKRVVFFLWFRSLEAVVNVTVISGVLDFIARSLEFLFLFIFLKKNKKIF